ncbi:MAG: hypothetical protein MRJ92_02430 [Nitrospira sp.]|nr:hypothetical protein [Nitrospira sp.]
MAGRLGALKFVEDWEVEIPGLVRAGDGARIGKQIALNFNCVLSNAP